MSGSRPVDPTQSADAGLVDHATRRSFAKRAVASALFIGSTNTRKGSWAHAATTKPSVLAALPSLEGELLVDDVRRHAAAADHGRQVRRVPVAVLISVNDVARMVAYAAGQREHSTGVTQGRG